MVTDRDGGKTPATLLKSLVDSYEEEDATDDDIDPGVIELHVGEGNFLTLEKSKNLWKNRSDPQILLS